MQGLVPVTMMYMITPGEKTSTRKSCGSFKITSGAAQPGDPANPLKLKMIK
jgi:hypothetical protein